MTHNHLAAAILATSVWIGIAALAIGGAPTAPSGEAWMTTSAASWKLHHGPARTVKPRVVAASE